MKTLLDEILNAEYSSAPYRGECNCACCARRAIHPPDAHWKERRRQRLGYPSFSDDLNDEYAYWRERRRARIGYELEGEANTPVPPDRFSATPNPIRQFFGMTAARAKGRKPRGWRINRVARGTGWVMVDENGNERIRFMAPNKRYKGFKQPVKWRHIATGYWIVRDGHGNYLDGDGNVIAGNMPLARMTDLQRFKLHIPYSGADAELGETTRPRPGHYAGCNCAACAGAGRW